MEKTLIEEFEPPDRGLIVWPVGTGDSITLVIDEDTVVQLDLHHLKDAESKDDARAAIIDELIKILPKRNGKPYLAVFGATHLDNDHICGFKRLLDEVTIGDLWFTPRVLWDQDQHGLSEDAEAFRDEAERRIEKMKEQDEVGSGDRIRIIGYHDSLKEHSEIYENLPEGAVTVPGSEFVAIDGTSYEGVFHAFVHAPFKDDGDKDRNDTSFGLRATLADGDHELAVMVLGDLAYPTVKRIFECSEAEDLEFDAFVAPHHCSKSVMYWQCEGDDEPKLQQDLLDRIEKAARNGAFIIASSAPIPGKNSPGDNPPHAKAAARYRELVDDGHFLCTGEYPSEDALEPIVFEVSDVGVSLREGAAAGAATSGVPGAVNKARGSTRPPQQPVGFGRE
jgi:beta-lactamase superfamily II metal-dependent hydrolase